MNNYRVFQGVRGQAGQPYALSQALKTKGIFAESYCNKINKFSYQHDHEIDFQKLEERDYFNKTFLELYKKFDVFHFHAGSFFNEARGEYPCFQDLYLLRDLGKKIIFHFRGSEARIESLCRQNNPYHYYDIPDLDVAYIRMNRSDKYQYRLINLVREVAHKIYVNDAEIQSYVPGSEILARAFVPQDDYTATFTNQNKTPLICHAPSRRAIKGTNEIIAVIDKLREQGLSFDFQLIEGLSHQEALSLYQKADIIIDQMRIGWYGVLTVEAMSMGKPVFCYIREDLKQHIPEPTPLVMTNLDQLENDLKKYISIPEERVAVGRNALTYYKKTHQASQVAEQLASDIEDLLKTDPVVEVDNPEKIIDRYYTEIAKSRKTDKKNFSSKINQKIKRFSELNENLTPAQFGHVLYDINSKRLKALQKYKTNHGMRKTITKFFDTIF